MSKPLQHDFLISAWLRSSRASSLWPFCTSHQMFRYEILCLSPPPASPDLHVPAAAMLLSVHSALIKKITCHIWAKIGPSFRGLLLAGTCSRTPTSLFAQLSMTYLWTAWGPGGTYGSLVKIPATLVRLNLPYSPIKTASQDGFLPFFA